MPNEVGYPPGVLIPGFPRLFLTLVKERQKTGGLTTVLATNVPEGLDAYADHVLLISRGRQVAFSGLTVQ